jgi:tRNA-specific 2-thiouridylase
MPRALLALSGGVDSAIAGLLLRQQGWDIHSVFIRVDISETEPLLAGQCPFSADIASARAAANLLGIPLSVVDFGNEYFEKVWQPTLEEYSEGLTPNPDILCNRFIKIGGLMELREKFRCDILATGHYALTKEILHDEWGLYAASFNQDGNENPKDQSYFLAGVNPSVLRYLRFPLGTLQKSQVIELAKAKGFPQSRRPESQGICLLGNISMEKYLTTALSLSRGDILNEYGEKIGIHNGAARYTIGQRIGAGIPSRSNKEKGWFVAYKDVNKNILVAVSGRDNPALYKNKIILKEPLWYTFFSSDSYPVRFKIRYRQPLQKGILCLKNNQWSLISETSQFAPAPGQTVVLYETQENPPRVIGSFKIG